MTRIEGGLKHGWSGLMWSGEGTAGTTKIGESP